MTTARDTVESWLSDNEPRIGGKRLKFERDDQYAEKFVAWYETDTHFFDIACWNHASCLDVLAINKDSGQNDFAEAGACDGAERLVDRLERFAAWVSETTKG